MSPVAQPQDEYAEKVIIETIFEKAADNSSSSDGHSTSPEESREYMISWEPADAGNPHNWSQVRPLEQH